MKDIKNLQFFLSILSASVIAFVVGYIVGSAVDGGEEAKKKKARSGQAEKEKKADAAAKTPGGADAAAPPEPASPDVAKEQPSVAKGIEHCPTLGPEHAKVTIVEWTDFQ